MLMAEGLLAHGASTGWAQSFRIFSSGPELTKHYAVVVLGSIVPDKSRSRTLARLAKSQLARRPFLKFGQSFDSSTKSWCPFKPASKYLRIVKNLAQNSFTYSFV